MKREDRLEEIQRLKRSPQYLTVDARFLGVTITVFILMLTVKSELLESLLIAGQLSLAIPFWIAALISQSKIVDFRSLKKYYSMNKISSGIALAFLYNTLGLLIVRYISLPIGIIFFSLFLIYEVYTAFFHLEIRKPDRTIRDTMVLLILIFGGLLPSLGIINF